MPSTTKAAPPSPDRILRHRDVPDVMTKAEVTWRRWWLHFNTSTRPPTATAIRCCCNVIALVDQIDGVAVIARRGHGSYDDFDLFVSSDDSSAVTAAQRLRYVVCNSCRAVHSIAPLRRDRRLTRRRNVNL